VTWSEQGLARRKYSTNNASFAFPAVTLGCFFGACVWWKVLHEKNFVTGELHEFYSFRPHHLRDYLNNQDLWSQCLEPPDVVPWNLTLFSILLIIGGVQMVLCAIQVINGLLGTLCGDCQCCGCCGVSEGAKPGGGWRDAKSGHHGGRKAGWHLWALGTGTLHCPAQAGAAVLLGSHPGGPGPGGWTPLLTWHFPGTFL
jgi:hypothetical protein